MRILTALLCPPISLLIASTADAFVPSTLVKRQAVSHAYSHTESTRITDSNQKFASGIRTSS